MLKPHLTGTKTVLVMHLHTCLHALQVFCTLDAVNFPRKDGAGSWFAVDLQVSLNLVLQATWNCTSCRIHKSLTMTAFWLMKHKTSHQVILLFITFPFLLFSILPLSLDFTSGGCPFHTISEGFHYNDIIPSYAAIISIIKAQKCAKVLVGDPHQQIYGFRGATDAMALIHTDHTFHLTRVSRAVHWTMSRDWTAEGGRTAYSSLT